MKKILLIEDERDVRRNLEDLLSAEGYEILSAEDGVEGYKLAITKEPDLILSDIRMPRMNGYDLLDKLQENPVTELIPFIFLTAKTEIKEMREGMVKGADDYIMKPFKADEILKAIETRLKKNEKRLAVFREFKDVLMKRVPHELRTPLVGILGMSGIIIEDADNMSKHELKEMAERIQFSGKRLHRRIEKFLIYAELLEVGRKKTDDKSGTKKYYEVNQDALSLILTAKAGDFRREKDIKVVFEKGIIKVPGWQYEIMVSELAENSMKYSKKGETVKVTGTVSGSSYITQITGGERSLSDIDYENINVFNQFGGEKLTEEGMGIGLAIVKKIVESADGHMSFVNSAEGENTIQVYLPIMEYK